MAQTDARAGFRLPWSSERSNSEQTETDSRRGTGRRRPRPSRRRTTAAADARGAAEQRRLDRRATRRPASLSTRHQPP